MNLEKLDAVDPELMPLFARSWQARNKIELIIRKLCFSCSNGGDGYCSD